MANTPTTTVTQTLPDSTAIEESHNGTGAIAATAYASCRLLLPPWAIEARRIEFARMGTLKCSATKKMVAKKGRAKFLQEKSLGHQDAGATSMWIVLKAMSDYCAGK